MVQMNSFFLYFFLSFQFDLVVRGEDLSHRWSYSLSSCFDYFLGLLDDTVLCVGH